MSRLYDIARRYLSQILVDAGVVFLSFHLSHFLLLGAQGLEAFSWIPVSCIIAAVVYCSLNYLFALYHRIWRFASAQAVIAILGSAFTGTMVLALVNAAKPVYPLSLETLFIGGFFTAAGFTAVRYRGRLLTGLSLRWRALWGHWPVPPSTVLIVGAGEAGQLLAWQLQNQDGNKASYNIVGFIDDDPKKHGMWIHGVKVLGGYQRIPEVATKKNVDLIILALPNAPDPDFQEIVSLCLETPSRIKLIPNTIDVIESNNGALPVKDITMHDLVDRDPVRIDADYCRQVIAWKVVLVTGAAGSIGSELCRQVLGFEPQQLIALDNNETGLYDLNLELTRDGNRLLRLVLGDITNRHKMEKVFRELRPHIVFHAAAYKHVPLLEEYPDEAVRVNVEGTVILSLLADKYGVERFIYISTDKAVNPTSVMGATKRIGEMWIAAMQKESRTLFTVVRFGNVMGSRGSVVPTFQRQIEQGGPVTVTHPEMARFFLSIPEAVGLTIQAASFTKGEEIYMLDMGKEVRIVDLARRMIRLRGLRVDKDIKIEFMGIRPGEKLHEELSYEDEDKELTPHPKIFRLRGHNNFDKRSILPQIMVLIAATKGNSDILARLGKAIIKASLEDVDGFLDILTGTRFPRTGQTRE
ncbi:MAG TPA: polysaccharide biosynthesis protein [Chloroflexi bacterium]|nr:polysaccharide biosynthesis protein [Chloroflexota bacterium]